MVTSGRGSWAPLCVLRELVRAEVEGRVGDPREGVYCRGEGVELIFSIFSSSVADVFPLSFDAGKWCNV